MFSNQEHASGSDVDFRGMYMAEVVDPLDPEGECSGRVRVRVFPMMVGLDEAVLPWAVPAMPLFEGGAEDMGAFVVPDAGSKVWVFFAAGDVRQPVYFAAALGMSDGPADGTCTKKVWKTRSGHKITIDDTEGSEIIEVLHKAGEKVVLTEEAIQIGKGTLKHLINEAFKTLFDAHKHGYVPSGSGTPALTTVPSTSPTGTPVDEITAAMITVDTEAS